MQGVSNPKCKSEYTVRFVLDSKSDNVGDVGDVGDGYVIDKVRTLVAQVLLVLSELL